MPLVLDERGHAFDALGQGWFLAVLGARPLRHREHSRPISAGRRECACERFVGVSRQSCGERVCLTQGNRSLGQRDCAFGIVSRERYLGEPEQMERQVDVIATELRFDEVGTALIRRCGRVEIPACKLSFAEVAQHHGERRMICAERLHLDRQRAVQQTHCFVDIPEVEFGVREIAQRHRDVGMLRAMPALEEVDRFASRSRPR